MNVILLIRCRLVFREKKIYIFLFFQKKKSTSQLSSRMTNYTGKSEVKDLSAYSVERYSDLPGVPQEKAPRGHLKRRTPK